MKNEKAITVERCEEWIRSRFENLPFPGGGIETSCFWKMAEEAGLWKRETYNSPMTQAVVRLTNVENVSGPKGEYRYSVFKLA